jgi:hypothetical protein
VLRRPRGGCRGRLVRLGDGAGDGGVGGTTWKTSLWPKEGGYVVPLKDEVRRAEGIELGDVVALRLELAL